MSLLEAKVNAKLEETNNLLREILKRDHCKPPKKRQLTHQKETLNEEEHLDVPRATDTTQGTSDDYYSLLGAGDQSSSRTFGSSGLPSSPAASSATRVLNLASKLVPKPVLRAARSVTETHPSTHHHSTHDSPREYSELTMTLDYEELKSSTLSTDDEDTNRDEASLRLNLLTSTASPGGLNRALSLQLPEPDPDQVNRGVLRQTHSDSKEPDNLSVENV